MLEEGQEYTAPVWLGEFGTNNKNNNYWNYLIRYLDERPQIGWSYWAYNGYKNDVEDDETFGIVKKDMKTVRHDWKLADLQKVQTGKMIEQNLSQDVADKITNLFILISTSAANERAGIPHDDVDKQITKQEA